MAKTKILSLKFDRLIIVSVKTLFFLSFLESSWNFSSIFLKMIFFFIFNPENHIYFTIQLHDDLRTGRDDLADRDLDHEHDF